MEKSELYDCIIVSLLGKKIFKRIYSLEEKLYKQLRDTGSLWILIPSYPYLEGPDLAVSMVDKGWILRNIVILNWNSINSESNCPDFDYLYFFVKKPNYYFNQILEPYDKPLNRWGGDILIPKGKSIWDKATGHTTYRLRSLRPNPEGKNKRNVWTVDSVNSVIEIIVKAGCLPRGSVLLYGIDTIPPILSDYNYSVEKL